MASSGETLELEGREIELVSGGFGPVIPAVGLALAGATFLMIVGERLHDAHCTDHR